MDHPQIKSPSSILLHQELAVLKVVSALRSLQMALQVFSTTASPSSLISEQVVTLGFDSFLALIGPTAAQADKSKNCQIHLNLQYPGGFQYAVVDAVYHGYARLDAGVTGTFLSTYFFSQNAAQTVRPLLVMPPCKRKADI
jgi:hypothetical protein